MFFQQQKRLSLRALILVGSPDERPSAYGPEEVYPYLNANAIDPLETLAEEMTDISGKIAPHILSL